MASPFSIPVLYSSFKVVWKALEYESKACFPPKKEYTVQTCVIVCQTTHTHACMWSSSILQQAHTRGNLVRISGCNFLGSDGKTGATRSLERRRKKTQTCLLANTPAGSWSDL
jgi:hypothetical protein